MTDSFLESLGGVEVPEDEFLKSLGSKVNYQQTPEEQTGINSIIQSAQQKPLEQAAKQYTEENQPEERGYIAPAIEAGKEGLNKILSATDEAIKSPIQTLGGVISAGGEAFNKAYKAPIKSEGIADKAQSIAATVGDMIPGATAIPAFIGSIAKGLQEGKGGYTKGELIDLYDNLQKGTEEAKAKSSIGPAIESFAGMAQLAPTVNTAYQLGKGIAQAPIQATKAGIKQLSKGFQERAIEKSNIAPEIKEVVSQPEVTSQLSSMQQPPSTVAPVLEQSQAKTGKAISNQYNTAQKQIQDIEKANTVAINEANKLTAQKSKESIENYTKTAAEKTKENKVLVDSALQDYKTNLKTTIEQMKQDNLEAARDNINTMYSNIKTTKRQVGDSFKEALANETAPSPYTPADIKGNLLNSLENDEFKHLATTDKIRNLINSYLSPEKVNAYATSGETANYMYNIKSQLGELYRQADRSEKGAAKYIVSSLNKNIDDMISSTLSTADAKNIYSQFAPLYKAEDTLNDLSRIKFAGERAVSPEKAVRSFKKSPEIEGIVRSRLGRAGQEDLGEQLIGNIKSASQKPHTEIPPEILNNIQKQFPNPVSASRAISQEPFEPVTPNISKVPEIPAYLDKAYQAASEAAGQVDIPGMSHEQKVKIYADKFKEAGVDLNNLTNDQQSLLNAMNAGKGELKNLLEQQRVKGVPYKEPGLSETAEKVSEHFPYSSKKHIVRTLIKDISSGGIDPSQTPLDAIWKLSKTTQERNAALNTLVNLPADTANRVLDSLKIKNPLQSALINAALTKGYSPEQIERLIKGQE